MTMARHLLQNPDVAHGADPDRLHAGRGDRPRRPSPICQSDLKADVAYTLDGAELGEIVYETFSADKADVQREGRVDPSRPGQGQAGQRACTLPPRSSDTLPQVTLTPETTDDRQGFIHLYQMSGTAAAADLHFILRDFERDGLRSARRVAPDRSAPPCRPPSRAPGSRARSRSSIATCATGWRTTCARSNWRGRPAARLGDRTLLPADPRRHRWLAPDRDGRADAQPVHRHAEHPRPAWSGSACRTWPAPPRCASSWRSCGAAGSGDAGRKTGRRTEGG